MDARNISPTLSSSPDAIAPDDLEKHHAIAALAHSLDASFFRAIAEPVRQKIIFILLKQGRSSVQQVAQHMVQDRSVVSRHLAFLEQAGFLRSFKIQRYTLYELDGPSIIRRLETILNQLKAASMACCPPSSALVEPGKSKPSAESPEGV